MPAHAGHMEMERGRQGAYSSSISEPLHFHSLPHADNRSIALDHPALRYLVRLQRAYGVEQHDIDKFPFDAEFRWCAANAANGWAADGIVFSDSNDYAVEAEGTFRFVGHKDAALFRLWFD